MKLSKVHELKIAAEYFDAVIDETKKFEIRKNDRDFKVGDFLLLKDFDGEKLTGDETMQQVKYISDYEQKKGYVVMSIEKVPRSFIKYVDMSENDKAIFKEVITTTHIHGCGDRDLFNSLWDIVRILLDGEDISDTDQQWYMELWGED